MSLYCLVENNEVTQGPDTLPKNWENVNNLPALSDSELLALGWYPYVEEDNGPPDDGNSYNRSLSPFDIQATQVVRTAIYTEWEQEQYDLNAETTVQESQRVATDLAQQTERLLQQDDYRLLSGSQPLIPVDDRADVETYLASCYTAMDDPAQLPTEPPGATRQLTAVPGENVDRGVIRRETVPFGGFVYQEIQYTLYTNVDATGMSLWIQRSNGTYLFTMPLVDQGNGVWYASTDKNGGMANNDDYQVCLFKGVKISQLIDLPPYSTEPEKYPLYFDVRWLNGVSLQQAISSTPGRGRNK